MKLPRASVPNKTATAKRALRILVMGISLSLSAYIIVGLVGLGLSACEHATPRDMTNGEAQAKCASLLREPIVGAWGDSHGWQCKSSADTWAYCYNGECWLTKRPPQ